MSVKERQGRYEVATALDVVCELSSYDDEQLAILCVSLC